MAGREPVLSPGVGPGYPPGVALISPHTPDNAPVEPDDVVADAALRLCCTVPGAVTGRIAYSMDLLSHPFPDGPWALPTTF